MRYIKGIFITAILLLTTFQVMDAQFYVTGDDPGRLKWNILDTDNFSIIYPMGSDSLARDYGYKLEKFRIPVSRTTGYLNKGRMPVVLHTYNTSNGSVAWAPKRMDLFTIPSAYDPEPMPWSTMLSVHEGRHVTQMQFGMTRVHKPIGWALGEMWNILASVVYPGISNIEGDAVIAETALTAAGRGRTADFLNYYMVAFDNGDYRRWDQWRFGSQRRYFPDYYALGYLTVGGFRYMYDSPMFINKVYERASVHVYDLAAVFTTAKKVTGKKLNLAFQDVCHFMNDVWREEAAARAPFIPMEQITAEPRIHADYQGTAVLRGEVYSIKSGYENSPMLVKVGADGKEKTITRMAHSTGNLRASEFLNRLYWSETTDDIRWSMKADSRIRYINLDNQGKRKLTRKDHLLFNPDINPVSNFTASVQYHPDGRSSLTVVNGVTGSVVMSVAAPEGVQPVETAWHGLDILVTGISEAGYGIYKYSNGSWTVVLEPQPVKIKDFQAYGDEVIFTCDRTGVNELYHLNPETGELRQKTVTRYGASDFAYDKEAGYLYFSSQTLKGLQMFRTPVEDLIDRPVDFTETHSWLLADKLAEQEAAVAEAAGHGPAVSDVQVNFSEPRRYRKVPHMFNLHSWAPVYVNVDNIMNMSFDYTWQAASLGATALMQSKLATTVSEIGYSAHKDPYDATRWRHSGHARLTYSGWYPVIEAKIDFNDRAARQYSPAYYKYSNGYSISLESRAMDNPYIAGTLSMYIPFNLSSGGWYKGFIPKVTYRISNDMFKTDASVINAQEVQYTDGSVGIMNSFDYQTKGKNTFRQSISASLRAYTMLNTAKSAVYPKWGIGVEIGGYGNIESASYLSPAGYGYVYGYVPGFMSTHGIRFTAMHQIKLNDAPFGQAVVNTLPRGLSKNTQLLGWLCIRNAAMTKVSADYAFPIYIGDHALGGGIFSIKRLVVNPHFDCSFIGGSTLFSVGGELVLGLNSILALGWPCSFGVTYSYNGGSGYSRFASESGITLGRHYVGPTFNVSF